MRKYNKSKKILHLEMINKKNSLSQIISWKTIFVLSFVVFYTYTHTFFRRMVRGKPLLLFFIQSSYIFYFSVFLSFSLCLSIALLLNLSISLRSFSNIAIYTLGHVFLFATYLSTYSLPSLPWPNFVTEQKIKYIYISVHEKQRKKNWISYAYITVDLIVSKIRYFFLPLTKKKIYADPIIVWDTLSRIQDEKLFSLYVFLLTGSILKFISKIVNRVEREKKNM